MQITTPEQHTNDLLRKLRDGVDVDDLTPAAVEKPTAAGVENLPPSTPTTVPDVVSAVLQSDRRRELIEVAKMLYEAQTRIMVFHTDIGDISCKVTWRSTHPKRASDELLIVKTLVSDTGFCPKPGSSFEISFDDHPEHMRVCCVSLPCQLYPGVELLCFIPQPLNKMEKNGKLNDDAPSVVSGEPSDTVDQQGEPVRQGEKSASATLPKPVLAPAGQFDTLRQ